MPKELYGISWSSHLNQAQIEIRMLRKGGQWKGTSGETYGKGLFFHFQRLQEHLYGKEKIWHRWNTLQTEMYLSHRTIGVLGPASSGKTCSAATDVLTDWYVWPECTTVVLCSTTKERLEDRVFGEVKKYHRIARKNFPNLPGNLIEGRLRICMDSRAESVEGRDFRNGIIGVPCFLTGTLVDTPNGKVPIENVKVGDVVLNACGTGVVKERYVKISKKALRIKLNDGRAIDCTEEHPLFTDRGWVNAVDLKTFDMVFSAHETLSIMQGKFRGRLSQPKILFGKMPRLFTSKALLPLQKKIQSVEAKVRELCGKILQHCLRWSVGSRQAGFDKANRKVMHPLREGNENGPFQPSVLFHQMPEQAGGDAVQALREGVYFNPRITRQTKESILQQSLQMERDAESFKSQDHISNSGGVAGVETVPASHVEPDPAKWSKAKKWFRRMVQAGYSVSYDKAGCGDRRRDSQDTNISHQGCQSNQDSGGAWVDSVEVLEPRGDERYSESAGGYTVHNLAVGGHPSYSVNGVIVHNCKRGGDYVGLGDFIGIKNKRVRLVADELQLLPAAFILAISNLDKNEDFKAMGLGNPKETTDALGVFCEPAYELGGWDGGVDQSPETKTWKTRRPDGICIQLVGSDSPNLDGELGIPLITQSAIDRDVEQYGKDSLQFTMMNQGMMPKGQGSRRVITKQLCQKNRAFDAPEWLDSNRIRIGFLDAAYKGVGGDRCVFGELQIGRDTEFTDSSSMISVGAVANQSITTSHSRRVVALIDQMIVPLNVKIDIEVEDQIVNFVKTQCNTRDIPPENFYFDSGMRTSLVSAFARAWSPLTNSIDCGGKPSSREVSAQVKKPCFEHYSKRITELWFNVRGVIESKQFRGMKGGVMDEGCQREWTMVSGNRIEVEPKAKMKEKTGKSPDLFDALAIGVEGAIQQGFVISNVAEVDHNLPADNRYKDLAEKAIRQWREDALNHDA